MNLPATIADAASALRRGHVTPIDLVQACLATIDQYEPSVKAWIKVDRAGALQAAEKATNELADGHHRSHLHGIPIGIKDIVDVAGWPTRAGSGLTSEAPANRNACILERLSAAGAIILGKTVTTEFACFDPPPTLNPWDARRTPGGSSSGSAAAVSMGMCLGAIGSQTGGSINRPATYCGVSGLKPTFGRVSRAGVFPVSFHLDHVGPIARTVTDCGLMLAAIAGHDPADPASSVRPGIELPDMEPSWTPDHPPRLGIVRKYFFDSAESESAEIVDAAVRKLIDQGAQIVELPLPDYFVDVHAMHRRIMAAEAFDVHRRLFGAPREGYGPKMRDFLAEGESVTLHQYEEALRHRVAFRNAMQRLLADVDAVLVPATPGPAPDTTTTGDARFNSPWSHAGIPSVSFPCGLTTAGLPVAMQLVGEAWSEDWLLPAAEWCEKRLAFRSEPPLLARKSLLAEHSK
jgi:aspartyl-tRNA(Asn)/glutamyl-tRNA(Gln) amidotransferase subunit A